MEAVSIVGITILEGTGEFAVSAERWKRRLLRRLTGCMFLHRAQLMFLTKRNGGGISGRNLYCGGKFL